MNQRKISLIFLKKEWLFIFILILLSSLFFRKSFAVYFSQDDFYRFKMGRAESLASFFNFFLPVNQIFSGLYRPLTTNVYSFLGQQFFGYNHFLYHFLNYSIFSLNLILVYKLFKYFLKNKKKSFYALIFYSLASFHFISLSYISWSEEIIVASFYFLTILLYLKNSRFSPLVFLFALLSRETAVTLPLILFMIEFFEKKNFRRLLPYIFLLSVYAMMRFYFNLIPENNVYRVSFSPGLIINNYFWFFIWGLGAPENLIDFVGPGLKIDSRFFATYPGISYLILIFSLLTAILFALIVGRSFLVKQKRGEILFSFFWFIITLSPFVFLLFHRFAYYLEIPFWGICAMIASSFYDNKKLRIAFLGVFLFLSFISVEYYAKTHWSINRAKFSRQLIEKFRKEHPCLPKKASIYFLNDDEYISPSKDWGGTSAQAKLALSGCHAFRLIYKDDSLECYFEDDGPPPEKDFISYKVKANLDF